VSGGGGGLRRLQKQANFLQEEFRTAGLGEELEGLLHLQRLLFYKEGIGGVGGEHEQATGGQFMLQASDKLETGFFRHGDVAEDERGRKSPRAFHSFGRGVGDLGVKAIGLKDEMEGVGDESVVVHNQNTLFHR
jgi:hypothetical protein